MFGKVFTLVFRECSKARLLVWGYCPQLYLNLFLQNRHCSVIAIIIRFLYLLRTIICLIVSYQYKVWIGRDLEECHDSVDSGPLHMVLCIQLPPPPLSHYLLLCDGWHNTGVISIRYQQKHEEVLLSLILSIYTEEIARSWLQAPPWSYNWHSRRKPCFSVRAEGLEPAACKASSHTFV